MSFMGCTRMAVKYHSSSLSGDAYDYVVLILLPFSSQVFAMLTKLPILRPKKTGWFYSSWKVFQGARFRVFVNSNWSRRFAGDLFTFTYLSRPWVSKDGINIIINIFPCSQQITNLEFTGSFHVFHMWLINAVYKVPMTRNFFKLTSMNPYWLHFCEKGKSILNLKRKEKK